MVALDTATGDRLWIFDANESLESIWGTPFLIDDVLYFADSGGQLYALKAANAESVWQTNVSGTVVSGLTISGTVVSGLTMIDDGFVLATQEGTIKAVNLDGSTKWESTLDGEIYQAPAANGDILVVGTIDGDNLVFGYNLTGAQLWSTTPED